MALVRHCWGSFPIYQSPYVHNSILKPQSSPSGTIRIIFTHKRNCRLLKKERKFSPYDYKVRNQENVLRKDVLCLTLRKCSSSQNAGLFLLYYTALSMLKAKENLTPYTKMLLLAEHKFLRWRSRLPTHWAWAKQWPYGHQFWFFEVWRALKTRQRRRSRTAITPDTRSLALGVWGGFCLNPKYMCIAVVRMEFTKALVGRRPYWSTLSHVLVCFLKPDSRRVYLLACYTNQIYMKIWNFYITVFHWNIYIYKIEYCTKTW
jgi:hypothetical protein